MQTWDWNVPPKLSSPVLQILRQPLVQNVVYQNLKGSYLKNVKTLYNILWVKEQRGTNILAPEIAKNVLGYNRMIQLLSF